MEKIRRIKNSLWAARKRMGFSQMRVAHALGLRSTSVLSRYEHGARVPNLASALKLEIVYRIPVAFLFGGLYGELKREIRKKEEKLRSPRRNGTL